MIGDPNRQEFWGKGLSLALALMLWLAVLGEGEGELSLSVPVTVQDLPPGLFVVAAPEQLQVTVAGPRILLWRIRLVRPSCRLGLSGAGAGTVRVDAPERFLSLSGELRVVRAHPSPFHVALAAASGR